MKSDTKFDHRRDSRVAGHQQLAAGGTVDRGNHLQQRALAGTVPADQSDGLAVVDSQRYVPERPEILDRFPLLAMEQTEELDLQFRRGIVPEQELLRHRSDVNRRHYSCSEKRLSNARIIIMPTASAPSEYAHAIAQIVGSGHSR